MIRKLRTGRGWTLCACTAREMRGPQSIPGDRECSAGLWVIVRPGCLVLPRLYCHQTWAGSVPPTAEPFTSHSRAGLLLASGLYETRRNNWGVQSIKFSQQCIKTNDCITKSSPVILKTYRTHVFLYASGELVELNLYNLIICTICRIAAGFS